MVPTMMMAESPRTETEALPAELLTFCEWHMEFSSVLSDSTMRLPSSTAADLAAYYTTDCWSRAMEVAIQALTSTVHWSSSKGA